MLAVTDVDVFILMNGVMQKYPRKNQPKVYYGLSSYFATSPQREHALVLDAKALFNEVEPAPSRLVDEDGVINWEILDAYLDTNPKKLPLYRRERRNVIDEMIHKAEANDKHALSAMLSNFTPASRPAVKAKVIAFLTDPKATRFSLPTEMQPKRGRAVAYYQAATEADYSELKADIQREKPEMYESRYWAKVIAKERAKG